MHVRWLLPALLLLGCPSDGGGNGSGDGGSSGGGLTGPVSCASDPTVSDAVRFEVAFGGETFTQPLKLVQHPSDDDLFYVVEKNGTVEMLRESDPANTRALFVDLDPWLPLVTSGERGLLGMAFDPDFDTNGRLFLSYTEGTDSNFDSVIGRFTSLDGGMTVEDPTLPPVVDPTVIAIDQPFSNHNGGDIAFGPDGYLYYSMGDGGGGGDPTESGQDITSLLGTIMRLDVSTDPYGIPPTNPYVGSGGADEIYAVGLRNPWRMSFDSVTGELWVGDVGQGSQEEVDRIELGGNYGWDCYEGLSEYEIDASCLPAPIEPEVAHLRSAFRSITGGYVYRDNAIPELTGAYVYGDFATGAVCALFFDENPPRVVDLVPPGGLSPSAFGQDRAGRIYLVSFFGTLYRIDPF